MELQIYISCLERKYSSGCESAMRISVLFVWICGSVERGEEVIMANLLITASDTVSVLVVVVVVVVDVVDVDR